MIEEIVEIILKEARSRKGRYLSTRISTVQIEINRKICDIMDNLREEERRLSDEDKG